MIADLVREELAALVAYSIPHPPRIEVRLDANESPFALPADVAGELAEHLARVALHRYPDSKATALRAALARETGCDTAQLVIGNGSDELITMLLDAFARPRPGQDRPAVAWPSPSFVFYRIAALGRGYRLVEVPLAADFTLDGERLAQALARERPNVAFFALPNNPTGTLWPREALLDVLAAHPDMIVVADEAYLAYSGASHLDLLPRHPNLVVLRTLSKIGMAALRAGYLVASPEIVAVLERIRPPYNVGSLPQAAAAFLLDRHGDLLREQARAVVDERERVSAALAASGLETFATRANFVLVRSPAATALWSKLAERGILVRNFDRPGPLAGCLRITIGAREENDRLLRAVLE